MTSARSKAQPKALAVIGPTASGKTALAIALARRYDGVVVNFDSMQVYRELNILTARPTAAEMAAAPHRLFGYLSVREAGNAARWRIDALAELAAADAAGRRVVLVGGTGLYLSSLINGLSDIPEIEPQVRARVRGLAETAGDAGLAAALAEADPAMAAKLSPDDGQRLARALEVIWGTGRSLADWTAAPAGPGLDRKIAVIRLDPPRDALAARIDARVWAMVEQGVLEEVRAVRALDLDPALPAAKAHGLREFGHHLAGDWTLAQAVTRTQAVTRQYAKRQRTWGRHRQPADVIVPVIATAQFLERNAAGLFSFIDDFLLTPS